MIVNTIRTTLNRFCRQVGWRLRSTAAAAETPKHISEGGGCRYKFFKSLFHDDNLVFTCLYATGALLIARSYRLEGSLKEIKDKVDSMDKKIDSNYRLGCLEE